MEGWGPPPLFKPCCWEPLDSKHCMGSVLKNTERGGFRKTSQRSSQARSSHLDLSFLPLFFFRALCCFRSCKKSRQRREKSIDQTIYFSRRTEKVRDSPSFWDRSGNLRFSRPLSFRSLYGWLFLSACPQPLTKHTGCGLCQASPGRVQEVEIWGSEGSWPLGLRGPRSLLDLTSGGSGYAGSFLPGVEGTANGDRRPCPEDSSL